MFVDPSGHRVLAARLAAAALTLVGVAFITGTGLLLSNQPTTTALTDTWSANAAPQAAVAAPDAAAGTDPPAGVASGAVSGQAVADINHVAVTQRSTQDPRPASPGVAPAVATSREGQETLAPDAPAVAAPPDAAPRVLPPPVAAPPIAAPPVTAPPVAAPAATQPVGLIPRVVSVVDPVVSTVGSLLGHLL